MFVKCRVVHLKQSVVITKLTQNWGEVEDEEGKREMKVKKY